jgi:hypothetical protein
MSETLMHCLIELEQGRLAQGASGLGLLARQDLAATPLVSAVLEAPELFALMRRLFEVS